jgi:hypothetical protein
MSQPAAGRGRGRLPDAVVPGHDTLVLTRFPPAKPDFEGIAARLA